MPLSPIRRAARSLSSSSLSSGASTLSEPFVGEPRRAASACSTESTPRGVPGGRGEGTGVVLRDEPVVEDVMVGVVDLGVVSLPGGVEDVASFLDVGGVVCDVEGGGVE